MSSFDSGYSWNLIGNYPNFELLLEYINGQTYKNGDDIPSYQIEVNKDVTVPANFTLPNVNKAANVILKCENGAEINIGSLSTVSANVNIVLENVRFKTSANTITFNAQKNLTVVGSSNVNVFRGNSSSTFIYNGNSSDYFDITGFKGVDVDDNSVICVNSTI